MMQRIRVLIVDDQTLVREGFHTLLQLEVDFEVVGTAGSGKEAISVTEHLQKEGRPPDVVLMDIRMPHMDGIAATRIFKERWPAIRIVILTTFDDVELIHMGLSAGALGYSLKDMTAEQLAVTIRTAARGQMLLQSEIASKAFSPRMAPHEGSWGVDVSSTDEEEPPVERLTEREGEILALVARGASNRQIAEQLYVTEGTVKNHVSSILGKLGVRDRLQAVLRAKERGLV
jgi:DNA-binding NarL/FixJ family response regulator